MNLKELLKSKGIKQGFLARKIGVTDATFSGWVVGRCRPTYENLALIADALGMSVAELIPYFVKGA